MDRLRVPAGSLSLPGSAARIAVVLCLAASSLGAQAPLAQAAVTCRTWVATVPGAWEDAANWGGNVPDTADECAVVPNGKQVTLSTEVTIASIVFRDGGTFTIQADGHLTLIEADTTMIFETPHSVIESPLVNDGAVTVTSGALEIKAGGHGSGTLEGEPAGEIRFGGGTGAGSTYELDDGARLLGGVWIGIKDRRTDAQCEGDGQPEPWIGTCQEAGRVVVGEDATASAEGVNHQYGGEVGGEANSVLTIDGTWHWTSAPNPVGQAPQTGMGTMQVLATGTVEVDGPFGPGGSCGFNPGGSAYLCGGVNLKGTRTIENHGTVVLSGAGFIAAEDGTSFENHATFEVRNDRGFMQGDGRGSFTNETDGTVLKSGPGTAVIDADFTNLNAAGDGGIEVTEGRLSVPGSEIRARLDPSRSVATGSTDEELTTPEGRDITSKEFATSVRNTGSNARVLSVEEGGLPAFPNGYEPFGDTSTTITNESASKAKVQVTVSVDSADAAGASLRSVQLVSDGSFVPPCPGPTSSSLCVERKTIDDSGDLIIRAVATLSVNGAAAASGPEALATAGSINLSAGCACVTVAGDLNRSTVSIPRGYGVRWRFNGRHRMREAQELCRAGTAVPDTGWKTDASPTPAFPTAGRFQIKDVKTGKWIRVRVKPQKIGGEVQWSTSTFRNSCSATFKVWKQRKGSHTWTTFYAGGSRYKRDIPGGTWRFKVRIERGGRRSGTATSAFFSG